MAAKRWFLVLALAGCGAQHAQSPAWPKLHEAEKDGGESLAPHAAASSVASVEKGGDEEPTKPAATTTAPAAPATKDGAAPTGTAPTMIQEDVPVQAEDIIIELDD